MYTQIKPIEQLREEMQAHLIEMDAIAGNITDYHQDLKRINRLKAFMNELINEIERNRRTMMYLR